MSKRKALKKNVVKSNRETILIYRPGQSGKVEYITASPDGGGSELRRIIGGWLQGADLPDHGRGVTLLVDEEGMLKGLPYNREFGGIDIVGTAVFHKNGGLSKDDVARIKAIYG